jgi:hypothetical protein
MPDGTAANVRVKMGRDATPEDIAAHMPVVTSVRKYVGLSGRVRLLLAKFENFVSDDILVLPGQTGFEARLEVEKLKQAIAWRTEKLRSKDLPVVERTQYIDEIEELSEDIAKYEHAVDDISMGADHIAVRFTERQGKARFSQLESRYSHELNSSELGEEFQNLRDEYMRALKGQAARNRVEGPRKRDIYRSADKIMDDLEELEGKLQAARLKPLENELLELEDQLTELRGKLEATQYRAERRQIEREIRKLESDLAVKRFNLQHLKGEIDPGLVTRVEKIFRIIPSREEFLGAPDSKLGERLWNQEVLAKRVQPARGPDGQFIMKDGEHVYEYFDAPSSTWYRFGEEPHDLGHNVSAAEWWNEFGRYLGRRRPEQGRRFMNDERNYRFEKRHGEKGNRARGSEEPKYEHVDYTGIPLDIRNRIMLYGYPRDLPPGIRDSRPLLNPENQFLIKKVTDRSQ